jgi:sodium transport system permease protein
LPGCVLLCALLCLVCGKARTFRQGQQTILPVMIITLLPTAVALQPGLEHSALLALVPFAGPALSLRDALRGELTVLPTAVMFASHALWSWLVLARVATLLDAERVLSTASNEAESAARHLHSRHALRWAFAAVLVLYVVGGRLQAWHLERGLALSLWVLLPTLTVLCAWRARRATGSWLDDLRLAPPPLLPLAGALLCVPALVFGMRTLLEWQAAVLPLPEALARDTTLAGVLADASSWKLAILFALSPAVCEELFFRGAVLSGLRRDLGPWRAVLWQAVFFAAAHASVHRLLPTGLIGVLLGALTLRTRSLWPAMLVHLAYNGIVVLDGAERIHWPAWGGVVLWSPHLAWLAVPGLALLALRTRR